MEMICDRVLYPIQPDIAKNTHGYRERITLWNPLTRNNAVLFQFEVRKQARNTFCLLPDGCVELLLRCDTQSPLLMFFGKRTKARELTLAPGLYFGFRPFYEAGFQMPYMHPLDVIDQVVELQHCDAFEKMIVSLACADSFEARCSIFAESGLGAFWDKTYTYDRVIECSRKICLSGGTIQLGTLCRELGYTGRHIRKLYKNVFGISPVFYKEIIRFQSSVHRLSDPAGSVSGYADLSIDSGYCNQSYMISTYKKFTQMTPKMLQEKIFA